jgi:hypothetical protein
MLANACTVPGPIPPGTSRPVLSMGHRVSEEVVAASAREEGYAVRPEKRAAAANPPGDGAGKGA